MSNIYRYNRIGWTEVADEYEADEKDVKTEEIFHRIMGD